MGRLGVVIPALLLAAAASTEAHAYIGPGAGVSLLGSLFGLVAMLGLVLWAGMRWAFRALVPARPHARSEKTAIAGVAAIDGPSGGVNPDTNRSSKPWPVIAFCVAYLLLGILIASVSSYPRELAVSWKNALTHVARGFNDPVVEFHTEPARFPASRTGVITHRPDLAFAGLNLELSSSAPEARLLDMEGQLLHRWRLESKAIGRAWAAAGEPIADLSGLYWRRAKPLPDGSLLVVLENPSVTPYAMGMMKLDWHSNVVWMAPARYHHSVDVGPDGRIYTLYQELARERVSAIRWIEPPFLNEGVAILRPDGTEIERINIIDAFLGTPFESFLLRVRPDEKGDSLHLNMVTVITPELADRSRIGKAGQLLVSIREMNTVAVIDPTTRKVVWAESDLWAKQHEPVLTRGSNVLVFDNRGPLETRSRAIEWDTARKTVVWQWSGTAEAPLASWFAGTIALLANGNRLVTESYGGRAIEVTEDGRIAWEWRTDRRFGEAKERAANLMEIIRLPSSFFGTRNLRTSGK